MGMTKKILFINEGKYSYLGDILEQIKSRISVVPNLAPTCLEIDLLDRNRDFEVDIRSVFGGVVENQKANYDFFLGFHGRGYAEEQPNFKYGPGKTVFRICYADKIVDPKINLEHLITRLNSNIRISKLELIPRKYSFGIPRDIGSGDDAEARLNDTSRMFATFLPKNYSSGIFMDIPYGTYNFQDKVYEEEIALKMIFDLGIIPEIKASLLKNEKLGERN